jgi:hypothetical protein
MPAYGTATAVQSINANDPFPVQIMTTADGHPGLPFTTVPCAISKEYGNSLGSFSVQVKFSAAPAAGTAIDVQAANEDVAASYVVINTFTFSGTDTTQRFDAAGFQAAFVRAVVRVHVGTETCIIEVGK